MSKPNGAAKYVYGVVRAGDPQPPKDRGINDVPLDLVTLDGLAALTSDIPDEFLEAGRDELLTHGRVLQEALDLGAVLPMRFGVVLPSEQSVRDELLAPHRGVLEAQLDAMSGKVEVNIKGIYEERAVLQEVVKEHSEIAALLQAIQGKPEEATYFERIRLGELVAEALTLKRDDDERAIVDRLLAVAVAVEVSGAVHERMAANASFLIERDRLDRFDQAVDEIGREQAGRIRLKYTGPLPPHSFVELGMER